MSSPTRAMCLQQIGLLFALGAVPALPAQTSATDVLTLVRALGPDATGMAARDALLQMGEERLVVEGEPVASLLARMVTSSTIDEARSIEVLALLGELGPHAVDAVSVLDEGFGGLPTGVWPAALRALGRTAPYLGAGRLDAAELLDAIFARLGDQPTDEHHDIFVAWIHAEERSRIFPRGSTASLIGKVSRGWGGGLGIVIEDLGRRGDPAALGTLRDYLERGAVQMPEITRSIRGVEVALPLRGEGMRTAAEAMVKIDPDHPDSLVAHAVLLRSRDPMERQRSMNALGTAGPAAAGAVPFLEMNLSDASAESIADSCTALGMIGPAARGAIPALEALAEHEDRQIAARAAAALRRIR